MYCIFTNGTTYNDVLDPIDMTYIVHYNYVHSIETSDPISYVKDNVISLNEDLWIFSIINDYKYHWHRENELTKKCRDIIKQYKDLV
jgi:hypothetical protein